MNAALPQESKLVTRVYSQIIAAQPMIDALRHLKKMLPLAVAGIDDLSPSDKFVCQLVHSNVLLNGSGLLTTLPADVQDIMNTINHIGQQHD